MFLQLNAALLGQKSSAFYWDESHRKKVSEPGRRLGLGSLKSILSLFRLPNNLAHFRRVIIFWAKGTTLGGLMKVHLSDRLLVLLNTPWRNGWKSNP
jgi:hypothetical protein